MFNFKPHKMYVSGQRNYAIHSSFYNVLLVLRQFAYSKHKSLNIVMNCCHLLDTRGSWTAPSVPRTSVTPCHSILTQMAFRNPVAITSPVCQQCAAGRHFAKFDEPIPKRKLPVDGSQLPMGITFGGADERSGVAVATTSRRVIVRSAQTLTFIKSASRSLSRRTSHCCKQVFTKGKSLLRNKHKSIVVMSMCGG